MIGKSKFIHEEIYYQIMQDINSNKLKAGDKLPTEIQLSKKFNCSRATIRRALDRLEKSGYIFRKSGSGTFINYNKMNYSLNKLESFTEQLNKTNDKVSSKLLSIDILNVSDLDENIKQILRVNFDENIYKVARKRYSNEQIMAYEIAYIRQKYCPNLQKHLEDSSSLYNIYENIYNLKMEYGDVTLESIKSTPELSKILSGKISDPLLLMNCSVYLENHDPLYHVVCYYVGNKYVFSARQYR